MNIRMKVCLPDFDTAPQSSLVFDAGEGTTCDLLRSLNFFVDFGVVALKQTLRRREET